MKTEKIVEPDVIVPVEPVIPVIPIETKPEITESVTDVVLLDKLS